MNDTWADGLIADLNGRGREFGRAVQRPRSAGVTGIGVAAVPADFPPPTPRGRGQLGAANLVAAGRILFDFGRQLLQRLVVGRLAETAQDSPWVHLSMIVWPTSASAGEAMDRSTADSAASRASRLSGRAGRRVGKAIRMTERCKRYQRPRQSPTVARASEKPLAQASWVYSDVPRPGPAQARAQGRVVRQPPECAGECAAVAGGHDEAVAPAATRPPAAAPTRRSRPPGGPGSSPRSPPAPTARETWLSRSTEARHLRGAVQVAQLPRRDGSRLTTPRLACADASHPEMESGPHAGQDERGGRRAQTRFTPGPRQHPQPLLAGWTTHVQEPDLALPRATSARRGHRRNSRSRCPRTGARMMLRAPLALRRR